VIKVIIIISVHGEFQSISCVDRMARHRDTV